MNEEQRTAVHAGAQIYAALVDEQTLLTMLGACVAQVAHRRELESPRAAAEQLLEDGAFDVDDADAQRRQIEGFSRLARRRFMGAGIALTQRGPGPSAN